MAYYLVESTVTNPKGIESYQYDSVAQKRVNDFLKSLNLIKKMVRQKVDNNTMKIFTVFESEAAYQSYMSACRSNADWLARKSAVASQGISVTETGKVVNQ